MNSVNEFRNRAWDAAAKICTAEQKQLELTSHLETVKANEKDAKDQVIKLTVEKDALKLEKSVLENELQKVREELEVEKLKNMNQGVFGENLVRKLFQTSNFGDFVLKMCKPSTAIGIHSALEKIKKVYPELKVEEKG